MKPLLLVADIDISKAEKDFTALVRSIEAGNKRMASSTAALYGAFLNSKSAEAKAYKEEAAAAERSEKRKTSAQESGAAARTAAKKKEETATERLIRVQKEWEAQVSKQPVFIANRAQLKGVGPMQGPPTLAQHEDNQQMAGIGQQVAEVRRIEAAKTAAVAEGVQQRRAIKQTEAFQLSAHDKAILREELKTGMARASAENDLFQRQRQTTRAQTVYRLKLAGDDAEMRENILKTHLAKMRAIQQREEGFSKTPFQSMLRNQGEQIAMFKKLGPAAQQAGYQIGDFAVQVASGQGVIRPFIQQGTQLLQFFGPWGSVIGAGVAVLGALYVGLKKTGDEAERTKIRFKDWATATAGATAAQKEHEQAIKGAAKGLDMYGINARIAEGHQESYRLSIEATTKSLRGMFGSVDAAKQHEKDLKGLTKVQELEEKVRKERLAGTKNLPNDLATQEIDNSSEITRIRQEYAQKREEEIKAGRAAITVDAELKAALEKQEQYSQAQRANIRKGYTDAAAQETTRGIEERIRQQAEAHKREQEEARRFYEAQVSAQRDLQTRLSEAYGQSEADRLRAKQIGEVRDLEATVANLDLSIAQYEQYQNRRDLLEAVHAQERINQAHKEEEEKAAKVKKLNKEIRDSYMAIGMEIAGFIDNRKLNQALQTAQQVYRILLAAKAIADATKAISLLSVAGIGLVGAGSAGLISGPAGLGGLGAVALAKGNQPQGGGPEVLPAAGLAKRGTPAASSTSTKSTVHQYNLGGITIQMPAGATPAQARQLGEMAGEGLLSRLRPAQTNIKDADYLGVSG